MIDPIEAIVFYAVFVFSVTLHEAAHATAALVGGDRTAYEGGQVSIDPVPHMKREPFGMVVLPVLGLALSGFPIGYASAPFNLDWAQRYPKRAAWMALAGPGANLALALAVALAIRGGMAMGAFEAPAGVSFDQVTTAVGGDPSSLPGAAAGILSLLFSMNLLLFAINMIPLPPLDGSGALPLILPEGWVDSYQNMVRQPMVAFVGILIVWNLIGEVFRPIFLGAINLLYPGAHYG